MCSSFLMPTMGDAGPGWPGVPIPRPPRPPSTTNPVRVSEPARHPLGVKAVGGDGTKVPPAGSPPALLGPAAHPRRWSGPKFRTGGTDRES
jgi:hypothetical protein